VGKPSDSNLLTLLSCGLLNEVIATKNSRSESCFVYSKREDTECVCMASSIVESRVLCVGAMNGIRATDIRFGWMGFRLSRVVATGNQGVSDAVSKILFFNASSMCFVGLRLRVTTASWTNTCFKPVLTEIKVNTFSTNKWRILFPCLHKMN
jgi:hypothetical protein